MDAITNANPSPIVSTRQRILDVALRLFSESGYLGVSMSDIAEQLGITKATLYHHFRGKSAIYREVLEDVVARLRAEVASALAADSPEDRLRGVVGNYVGFGLREKSLVNIVVTKLPANEPAVRERVVRFREELSAWVQPVVAENLGGAEPTAEKDARFLTSLLMWMMDGLLIESALLDSRVDPFAIADRIIAVLRGVSPTPGAA